MFLDIIFVSRANVSRCPDCAERIDNYSGPLSLRRFVAPDIHHAYLAKDCETMIWDAEHENVIYVFLRPLCGNHPKICISPQHIGFANWVALLTYYNTDPIRWELALGDA